MIKRILCAVLAFFIAGVPMYSQKTDKASAVKAVMKNIDWFGQSSIRIRTGDKIIYIDPLYYDKDDKADIILITHLHSDHYVYKNVQALMKKDTVVIAPSDLGFANRVMSPGMSAIIRDIIIEAVPAYNIVKANNHPKSTGNNGYIVTVDGVRVYHAGDTELIPEMKTFKADIALVPLGQTYTFASVKDAVQAVLDVKASEAIPIHFGMYEGTKADAALFAEELGKKGVIAEVREKKF